MTTRRNLLIGAASLAWAPAADGLAAFRALLGDRRERLDVEHDRFDWRDVRNVSRAAATPNSRWYCTW